MNLNKLILLIRFLHFSKIQSKGKVALVEKIHTYVAQLEIIYNNY